MYRSAYGMRCSAGGRHFRLQSWCVGNNGYLLDPTRPFGQLLVWIAASDLEGLALEHIACREREIYRRSSRLLRMLVDEAPSKLFDEGF